MTSDKGRNYFFNEVLKMEVEAREMLANSPSSIAKMKARAILSYGLDQLRFIGAVIDEIDGSSDQDYRHAHGQDMLNVTISLSAMVLDSIATVATDNQQEKLRLLQTIVTTFVGELVHYSTDPDEEAPTATN